ncbi:hypothetical protein Tco_1097192 [Tanacetum coccineum]
MEMMNVTFDELSTMDFEQRSLKPELQGMTSEPMYDDYIGGQPSAAPSSSSDSESSDSKCIYNNYRLYTDTNKFIFTGPSNNTSQDVDEIQPQSQHVQQQYN